MIVHNCVQAIARDLLCYGMMQVASAGFNIVLHVHDEVVVEAPENVKVETIEALMGRKPDWAAGLPHRADGYETMFYRKDD